VSCELCLLFDYVMYKCEKVIVKKIITRSFYCCVSVLKRKSILYHRSSLDAVVVSQT